jgi:hypothetical protein
MEAEGDGGWCECDRQPEASQNTYCQQGTEGMPHTHTPNTHTSTQTETHLSTHVCVRVRTCARTHTHNGAGAVLTSHSNRGFVASRHRTRVTEEHRRSSVPQAQSDVSGGGGRGWGGPGGDSDGRRRSSNGGESAKTPLQPGAPPAAGPACSCSASPTPWYEQSTVLCVCECVVCVCVCVCVCVSVREGEREKWNQGSSSPFVALRVCAGMSMRHS